VKMRDKCVWEAGRFCCVCKNGHQAFYSEQNPERCIASDLGGIACGLPMRARVIPFRPLGNVK
jgi:hypothetical protein